VTNDLSEADSYRLIILILLIMNSNTPHITIIHIL